MSKTAALAKVLKNENLTSDGLVKIMTLLIPQIAVAKPGQFVHIKVADNCQPLLRRPFSIAGADAGKGTIDVIYRVVGAGTAIMADAKPEDYFNCLGPLGNGFTISGKRPLLVGGGIGLAPLLFLAGALRAKSPAVLMGGRNAAELFWQDLFAALTKNIYLATDDGSVGFKGFAAQLLPEIIISGQFDTVYACGPRPMLQAVANIAKKTDVVCQVSLEEHMACGVGACLSCTCADAFGKRQKICTDGPVFDAGEVEW